MNATDQSADPVEEYVATLSAALHGPARAKARLVTEIRDGLTDAVADTMRDGAPYRWAAREVVRDFGTPEELVPSCQRELTIAQARHTARAVALSIPLLALCWHLVSTAGRGSFPAAPTQVLAVHLTVVCATAALLASATLTVTGTFARWLPTPSRLPLAVAWTGTAAGVAMALTTLTLAIAALLATDWPLMLCAGALAAVSHGVVATSARACRQCARLPATEVAVTTLR